MKTNFFEVVKKIDYVLFLLALVLLGGNLLFNSIMSIKNRSRNQQVVAVKDDDDKVSITQTTDYLTKVRDVYVFAVKSNAVKTESTNFATEDDAICSSSNLFSNKAGKSASRNPIVNMLFVRDDSSETQLFSKNVFIERYAFEHYEYSDSTGKNAIEPVSFPKNAYAVIENDDNGDGVLNTNDFVCLYTSDFDGTSLKKLAGNICFCRIEGDTLLFADYKDGTKTYYEYDSKTDAVKKIKAVKENASEKQINLWH